MAGYELSAGHDERSVMRQAETSDHSRHQTVTSVYDDLRAEALRNHERKLDVRFMSSSPASVQTLTSHQAAQHVAFEWYHGHGCNHCSAQSALDKTMDDVADVARYSTHIKPADEGPSV